MRRLRTHRSTLAAAVAILLVGAAVVVGSSIAAHSAASAAAKAAARVVSDSQRKGCARGKLDRTAIAAALRAQSTYLNGVLGATSVKQDVKDAAQVNQDVQDASATSLESRTGKNLVCAVVVPRP
jgi:Flp pilus assembly protein TadG